MGINFSGKLVQTNSLKFSRNHPPIWNTSPGSLGIYNKNELLDIHLSAFDPYGDVVTYEFKSGQLPIGCSLNTTTGILSGTPTSDGEFNFVITATDNLSKVHRSFLLTII